MSDASISYSLREMFDRLEAKLDRVVEHLQAKADRADVVVLGQRVDAVETRLADLEHAKASERERLEHKRWFWPTVWTGLAAVATVAGLLLALKH